MRRIAPALFPGGGSHRPGPQSSKRHKPLDWRCCRQKCSIHPSLIRSALAQYSVPRPKPARRAACSESAAAPPMMGALAWRGRWAGSFWIKPDASSNTGPNSTDCAIYVGRGQRTASKKSWWPWMCRTLFLARAGPHEFMVRKRDCSPEIFQPPKAACEVWPGFGRKTSEAILAGNQEQEPRAVWVLGCALFWGLGWSAGLSFSPITLDWTNDCVWPA